MFSICFTRFGNPFLRAVKSSCNSSSLLKPPWSFNALTVATITTAFGFICAILHLVSKNFSAPRSAPNPASVIVYFAQVMPSFVAIIELQPWAMLANGPQWTMAGVPINVCTRFGFIASFSKIAMASWTSNCLAYIGLSLKS